MWQNTLDFPLWRKFGPFSEHEQGIGKIIFLWKAVVISHILAMGGGFKNRSQTLVPSPDPHGLMGFSSPKQKGREECQS